MNFVLKRHPEVLDIFGFCWFLKFSLTRSQFCFHGIIIRFPVLKDFPWGVLTLIGRRLDSMTTASWSETPGITSTLLTKVWLLVKNRSKILDEVSVILVGSVTTWSRYMSFTMARSWFETALLVAYGTTLSSSQVISGKLKSPPSQRCAPLSVGMRLMIDCSSCKYSGLFLIPSLLSLKRLKRFGHLSNLLNKTCLKSHHSEKTEFLGQIQREKPTIVIGNSNLSSHVKATLTRPQKGLVRSPPWGT